MKLPFAYRGLVMAFLLVVALPCLAVHFAFRHMYTAWRDCRRMEVPLESCVPEAEEPVVYGAGSPELILSGALLDSVRRAAAPFAVQVAAYEPVVSVRQDGWSVHTARITLAGSFVELLRVADGVERTLPHCPLRSLEWRTTTEPRTRQARLTLTFYVQQILRNE